MNATDDWYDVTRLSPHHHRIQEADGYLMYLATGTDRACVVDAGIGVGDLRSLIGGIVDRPITLLLTHSHWDHIGAIAQFDDVRLHRAERPADGRVGIDTISDEFVQRPAQFVDRWRQEGNDFPDPFDPATFAIEPASGVRAMDDGDVLDLGDRALEIVQLPGHSPGHVGVLDRDMGVMYGGDIIHRDRNLYIHFEDCDIHAYGDAFGHLIDLCESGAYDSLLTGHNPTMGGKDLAILETFRSGLQEIIKDGLDFETVDTAWGPAHQFQIGDSTVLTKTSIP